MKYVNTDVIVDVKAPINYNEQNPVIKLMKFMEDAFRFAEEFSCYDGDNLQYLFPYKNLISYPPSGDAANILDPAYQNNKTDFQKQNIRDFLLTDTFIVRGWVSIGDNTLPFVKISYRGDPDSALALKTANGLDTYIWAYIKIGNTASNDLVKIPYNEGTHRYEIELWGDVGNHVNDLSSKAQKALSDGSLLIRPDLIKGNYNDFTRNGLDDKNIYTIAPDNTMHPLLPLSIELAWCDHTQGYWDNKEGKNYHYSFNMLLRGWQNFMQVGVSANPHGGIGFLHYRNLFSNYKDSRNEELSRDVFPWMFDANGAKPTHQITEKSLSVDYVDLHILKAECAIGIHRHRDNQEIFHLISGKCLMVLGDWYQFTDRERAFEIRTLLPGSMTLLKAGQLHALVNALDIDATLLMFGGYD